MTLPSGANARTIYSLPAGLFDAASAKGLATIRYSEPSRNGTRAACRGVYQPLIWRMEEQSDMWMRALKPGPAARKP